MRADALGRVAKYLYPFLYLDTSGFRDPEPMRLAAGRAALNIPRSPATSPRAEPAPRTTPGSARFRNSFHPERSGDVMLSYRPEYVEDYGQGRGISYGSLYNYDVRVPLCLLGPAVRAGRFRTPGRARGRGAHPGARDGRRPPSSSTGRVLAEALVE